MKDIYILFFELIQLAIGTRIFLSYTPTEDEWRELYVMAKKQSLVGVCFAGVQKLPEVERPPEMLYLTWMGMAAKIQQRNEVVNRQCAQVQQRLTGDGLQSCVLKGQGIAYLYGERLRNLRQSGDIDLWVKAAPRQVIEYAERFGIAESPTYLHVGVKVFEDTPVEMHWRPTLFRNLLNNRRIQRWCDSFGVDSFRYIDEMGVNIPSDDFNRIFNLTHLYRHFMFEGVGLRQLLDYYYILIRTACSDRDAELCLIKKLNLMDFTAAVMWVLSELFQLHEEKMICMVNEKEGRFLLNEVMRMGNFGRGDERYENDGARIKLMKKWVHLVTHYPSEVVWNPIWILCRKIRKY